MSTSFNSSFPVLHGLTISQGGYVQNLSVEQLPADPVTSGIARIWYSTIYSKWKISYPTSGPSGTADITDDVVSQQQLTSLSTTITQQIDGEATARQLGDQTTTTLIQAEQQRAELAEQSIISSTGTNVQQSVLVEQQRAEIAEEGLQSQLNNLQQQVNNLGGDAGTGTLRTTNTITFATTNPNQVLDSFLTSQYRSAKYTIQFTSGTNFEFTEVSLFQDGTQPTYTEYGTISSSFGPLATLSANISNGVMELMITPLSSNTTAIVERVIFSV